MSQASEGDSAFQTPAEGRVRRGFPPSALFGFVFLLALLFGAAYAVGDAVGPVAPGMHRTDGEGGGSGDHGGEPDSGDMGGMDMDHGSGS